jgi:hypothetical protein
MTGLRKVLVLAFVAAFALPAAASADTNPTRASISSTAQWISPQQINLEISLTCEEGLFYNVSVGVLQQQGFLQVFGSGFTNGQCTGRHQRVAVAVQSFAFPGWKLGEALASATACAFTCDSTSRSIRISL